MLNTKCYFKKYLEVLQFFKPKEKILILCLILYFLLNLMSNSPDARRVILVPIETTLYSNENSHTEKQPLFKKRPYT